MMHKLSFRRILPFAFTLLHLVTMLYSVSHHRNPASSEALAPGYTSVSYQEDGIVRWEPIEPRPLSPAQKVAIILNLPAILIASPIAAILFHGEDIGLLSTALLFVPLIWYGIGRWLDRMLGYIPPSRHAWKSGRGFVTALCWILLCISIVVMTPLNHHRRPDAYWVGSGFGLWSAIFVVICTFDPARRRHEH